METNDSVNGRFTTVPRFIALTMLFWTLSACVMPWDVPISIHSTLHNLPGDIRRIVDLSEIFAHGFGILIVLIAIALLTPEKKRYLLRFSFLTILPGLTAQGLKLFIMRDRPAKYYPDLTQVEMTWQGFSSWNSEYHLQSFPSAHTATAVGIAIGLSWLYPRGRNLFIFLGALASFQRIAASAHWTSDVFAGAAVGVATCSIIMHSRLLERMFKKMELRPDVNAFAPDEDIR